MGSFKTYYTRGVYINPANIGYSQNAHQAIARGLYDLQDWFRTKLGGKTFKLHQDPVLHATSDKPTTWFSGSNFYYNSLAEASRLLGAKQNDPQNLWVIYVDAPGGGSGTSSVAVMGHDDIIGLIGLHQTQPSVNRWIGGMGHELGHAAGLDHSPASTNFIMDQGMYKYPNTDIEPRHISQLKQSPFFQY